MGELSWGVNFFKDTVLNSKTSFVPITDYKLWPKYWPPIFMQKLHQNNERG